MKIGFISSAAIAHTTRSSISEVQIELAKAQAELASGRHHDDGLALGYQVSRAVSMRQEFDQLTALEESNGVLSERMTTTQDSLQQMVDNAQSMLATLLVARNSETNAPAVAALDAQAMLDGMVDSLGATFNGARIFGGINSDTAPMNPYYSTPPSLAKQSVDADFLAAFGMTQTSTTVGSIDGTSMQTFLDGAFANNFTGAAWTTNWSNASDQVIESRISISTTIQTSVSGNEEPFQQMAQALTMVADLGGGDLGQSAFQAVADTAIGLLGKAVSGLALQQARIAVAEEEIQLSNDRMELQKNVLTDGVQALEGVDPFEASTRATSLLTQLETSFALTARLQRLSLTNYL
ncbi:MAG: flagellar hook-associated family protein [Hyphomicrobiaceae bacterium]